MTTNQTIDGVSRKSLEQALKLAEVFDDGGDGADAESARGVVWILRALLDAPAIDSEKWKRAHALAMEDNVKLTSRNTHADKLLMRTIQSGALSYEGREMLSGLEADICAHIAHGNPAAQPQGEPVAYKVKYHLTEALESAEAFANNYGVPLDQIIPLYAEQTAPVAVMLPERSPQDYAIEHAEYMAQSADDVLAKFQAYGLALLAVDEGGDDGEGELLENIDSARGDLQESLVELRSMLYEFRKRSAKT